MPFPDLRDFAKAIIESIESDVLSLTDDSLVKLKSIIPEQVVIAALDLIDRESVIHHLTPWGYTEYEVVGSVMNYHVLVDIRASRIPYSCTCDAFADFVLKSRSHTMCKHILATLLARKLSKCITRPTSADDLAQLFTRQFALAEPETNAMVI